jgi:hypothetical protein
MATRRTRAMPVIAVKSRPEMMPPLPVAKIAKRNQVHLRGVPTTWLATLLVWGPFERYPKNWDESLMDQKQFSIAAGVIFAVVALFHLVRIYMGWPVIIGDWSVPMWVSWIGLIIAGGLAFFGLSLAASDRR